MDWKSSNAAAVTVEKGKVKAGSGAGFAVISGHYNPYESEGVKGGGFGFKVNVYVEQPDFKTEKIIGSAPELTYNKSKYTLKLKAGDICSLSRTGIYEPVLMKSSNNEVAFADDDGWVYARSAGAKGKDGKAVLTCRVAGRNLTINVLVSE